MVFDPQNLQESNRRFGRIVQAAVDQSRAGWSGGILVVEKTPDGVRCTFDAFYPDAAFWRQETANNEWQRSPSLLVIELILDCKDWDAANKDTIAQAIHFSQKFCA